MTKYWNIVVLTGAGISAESGLTTFRDPGGVWQQHRIEDVATPEAFERDPDRVHEFYNVRRRKVAETRPNPAHEALARLEREVGSSVLVVTQNIDDLHEKAGTRHLIHMHGEIFKSRCDACGDVARHEGDLTTETRCRNCGRISGLRPHVVWFGEMPMDLERIYSALGTCDLFLSIGTSGNVYPAAGFVAEVRAQGRARAVELNLEPSEGSHLFDEAIHGPAGTIVPQFVERLLGN